jgi:hypothetical protein
MVTQWSSVSQGELEQAARDSAPLDAGRTAGRIDDAAYFDESPAGDLYDNDRATYDAVAVLEVLDPELPVPEP